MLKFWQTGDGLLINEIAFEQLVCDFVYHPSENLLLIGTCGPAGGHIVVLDTSLNSWEEIQVFDLRNISVMRVDYNKSGTLIAAAHVSNEGQSWISIWNSTSGEQINSLECQTKVTAIAWSENENQLLSGHIDGAVFVWDILSGKPITQFNQGGHISSIDVSIESQLVAIGGQQATMLYRLNTFEKITAVGPSAVNSVRFSPDGSEILITSWDPYNSNKNGIRRYVVENIQ